MPIVGSPTGASNPRLSNAEASAAADAVCIHLNNGYLRIYDGIQPLTADTAITTQNLLVELRWSATAFNSASNGMANANAITANTAVASGTASWFRALRSDGTSVVFDGSVSTSGANISLASTTLSIGVTVAMSAFTYTQSES